MKIKMIFTNALIGLSSFAFGQQIIDLSTGIVNGSNTLISPGQYDDTWTVRTPFNSSFVPIKCVNPITAWQTDPNSRWISPAVEPNNYPTDIKVPYGVTDEYTYKTTFFISNACPIKNAFLTLNKIGGDNDASYISINDNPVHFIYADFNPLKSNLKIEIPITELNTSGLNTIKLTGFNINHWTGLLVNGNLGINYCCDPSFTLSTNYNLGNSFFTCFATPTVSTLPSSDQGYAWFVEEIVSSTNTTVINNKTASNPSCWWNSSPFTCDFHGYDGSRTTVMDPNCSDPTPGHFTAGHTYRITRGSWSNECPWSQYSVIVYEAQGRKENGIVVVEDRNAPDYSSLMNKTTSENHTNFPEKALSIYPNPGNGTFTINTNHISTGIIEIYNISGRKVESIQLKNNETTYKIDLTSYSKGLYLVNLTSGNIKYSEKIVIE